MKRYFAFLVALFVAGLILAAPGAPALFARGGGPGWARHHDRDDQGDHDRGEHRGQRKEWRREQGGRYRFSDEDRHAVDNYYRDHRDDRDFRERWRDDDGPRVAYGYVIGPRYRRYCRPVPVYLVRELPPPPYGYRYFLFNGNVVLLDGGYRVQDFIHLNINFGR